MRYRPFNKISILYRPLNKIWILYMALKICIFCMAAPPYCPGTALGRLQARTRRRAQGACVSAIYHMQGACVSAVYHMCACVSLSVYVCVCVSLSVRVRVSILRHTRTQAHTQCETCANLPTNLLRQPPPPISSMLRQAVVFCLVDLYRALGEDLIPHLDAGLSNSQLKLVTIYINRLQA